MTKKEQRKQRHKRIRAKIHGTSKTPRLSVFRSNKHTYAQLIDDEKGKTLIAFSDISSEPKSSKKSKSKIKTILAREIGKLIAEKSLKKNINKVVFDRGGYKYHGRIKAVADGAREGGLIF